MPTEPPSQETLLGPYLRRAIKFTFWAPRHSLLFGEYLLSINCVPASVLGTGRIHKRWLQPLTHSAIP